MFTALLNQSVLRPKPRRRAGNQPEESHAARRARLDPAAVEEAAAEIERLRRIRNYRPLGCIVGALALLWSAVQCPAATVTGTFSNAQGTPTTTTVRFQPLSNPQADGGVIIGSSPVSTSATNGVLSVTLEQGDYQVRAGRDAFLIAVPNSASSYNIEDLITSDLTYVYTAVPAAYGSYATSTSGGKVLVDADTPTPPVVYLKTTVDNLLAELGSGSVTSIDVDGGSTGLTVSGGPITTNGTLTIAGTLGLGSGGTGAGTPSAAAMNLAVTHHTTLAGLATLDFSDAPDVVYVTDIGYEGPFRKTLTADLPAYVPVHGASVVDPGGTGYWVRSNLLLEQSDAGAASWTGSGDNLAWSSWTNYVRVPSDSGYDPVKVLTPWQYFPTADLPFYASDFAGQPDKVSVETPFARDDPGGNGRWMNAYIAPMGIMFPENVWREAAAMYIGPHRLLHFGGGGIGTSGGNGDGNMFFGPDAGNYSITTNGVSSVTGCFNLGFGRQPLRYLTTGRANVVMGGRAGYKIEAGYLNSAFGDHAMRGLINGYQNASLGSYSLYCGDDGETDGDAKYNVAIGANAGSYIVGSGIPAAPDNGVYIGFSASPYGTNTANEIVIGYQAQGRGDSTITIGNTSHVTSYIFGDMTAELGLNVAINTDTSPDGLFQLGDGSNSSVGDNINPGDTATLVGATSFSTFKAPLHLMDTSTNWTTLGGTGAGILMGGRYAAGYSEMGAGIKAQRESTAQYIEDWGLGFYTRQEPTTFTEKVRITSAGNVQLNYGDLLLTTNNIVNTIVALASADTTIDFDEGGLQTLAMGGDLTFGVCANKGAGKAVRLRLVNDQATNCVLTLNASWNPFGDLSPITVPAGDVVRIALECFGTAETDVDCAAVLQN